MCATMFAADLGEYICLVRVRPRARPVFPQQLWDPEPDARPAYNPRMF